jgi:Rrf2 family transcriptional regulator, nitric oxide-sensitive transcriptional repressor
MRLTRYTDYSLRVLIYLGLQPERLSSIREIAGAYGISESHLMKVVQALGQSGYVATLRGRGGGLKLAKPPHEINVGDVVRNTEDDLALVECFAEDGACRIAGPCRLRHLLTEALEAFFAVLDRYTLADLLQPNRNMLKASLGLAAV